MDELKFGEFDLKALKGARKILASSFEYNYGDTRRREQVKRLETIINKLDALIEYQAKNSSKED